MTLEKFSPENYLRGYTGKPFVSIQKKGILRISYEFYSQFIPGTQWIEIFYDRDKRLIGFRALKEQTQDSIRIKVKILATGRKHPSYSANIRPFMIYYGIEISETIQFVPVWGEQEQMFLIELKQD